MREKLPPELPLIYLVTKNGMCPHGLEGKTWYLLSQCHAQGPGGIWSLPVYVLLGRAIWQGFGSLHGLIEKPSSPFAFLAGWQRWAIWFSLIWQDKRFFMSFVVSSVRLVDNLAGNEAGLWCQHTTCKVAGGRLEMECRRKMGIKLPSIKSIARYKNYPFGFTGYLWYA